MNKQRWVDLSDYGMKLGIAQISSGQRILHMQNGENQPEALQKLGFQRDETGQWFNFSCNNIIPRDFLRELSKGKIILLPVEKIFSTEVDTSHILKTVETSPTFNDKFHIPIGMNHLCQKVYVNEQDQRYILDKNDKPQWECADRGSIPAKFLRVKSNTDFESCVEGFIETISANESKINTNPAKFAKICGIDDFKDFYKATEKSINRRVLHRQDQTTDQRIEDCIAFYRVLKDSPIGASITDLLFTFIGRKLLGEQKDLIGSRIKFTGIRKDIQYVIAPKAVQFVGKNDDFDFELLLTKCKTTVNNSLKKLSPESRTILIVKQVSEQAAKKLLKDIASQTVIQNCGYFPEQKNGILIATVFGTQKAPKIPKLASLTNPSKLNSWVNEQTIGQNNEATTPSGQEYCEYLADCDPTLSNNNFQKPYNSLSKIGKPTTMIPRELDGATRSALTQIASQYNNVDKAMACEFGFSESEFKQVFAPEQVDALALAVNAESKNRGFLLADGTGVGKGRPLAALIVRAVNQGKKVIFLSEKDSNLSDIQRDIKHIGRLDTFTPVVLNTGVKLIDEETELPFNFHSNRALDFQKHPTSWPENVNVVYGTYSQFNRLESDSPRTRWLNNAVDENVVLIADEAHNAANGSSNISVNLANATDNAGSVFYSSATFAATSRMITFYDKLFPADIDPFEMGRIVAKGGEPLQEVITNMLVRDGVMIRRERDLSSIVFSQHVDSTNKKRNRDYMDKLSKVIAHMAKIAKSISDIVFTFNQQLDREEDNLIMRAVPFGLYLHSLTRFASACLCVDLAVERAIHALKNNEKPIIMVDNTVHAILEEFLKAGSGIPEFKSVLKRVFSHFIRANLAKNKDRQHTAEAIECQRIINQSVNEVNKLIDQLPVLNASPIDTVKNSIQEAGFTCGEITGRTLEVCNGRVITRNNRNRTEIKNGFNSGRFDALVINVASTTGIDLHASNRFKDQRRRVFIELQSPQSVQRQIQAFGRISRKNEAIPPRIEFLSAELPNEVRLAALRNSRLRRMSATVTSNRDSVYLTKHIPDIINSIGDTVITKYAGIRPDLMTKLCLDTKALKSKKSNANEFNQESQKEVKHSANTFLSRLSLLPTQHQERIIEELFSEYEFMIAELDAQGENPLRPKQIDGIVHLGAAKPFFEKSTNAKSTSCFDELLYLQEAKVERVVNAIDSNTIIEAVSSGSEQMSPVNRCIEILTEKQNLYLESYLPTNACNIEQAVSAKNQKILETQQRMTELCTTLKHISPGRIIQIITPYEEKVDAIITSISVPRSGFEHFLNQYRVKLAIPGEVKLKSYHISTLLKMPTVSQRSENGDFKIISKPGLEGEDYDKILRTFDESVSTQYRRVRILTSNVFKATRIATKYGLGSLVSFVNSNGIRDKGVLVRKDFEKKLKHLPKQLIGKSKVFDALTSKKIRVDTKPERDKFGVTIIPISESGWKLHLPRPQRRGGYILWKSEEYKHLFSIGMKNKSGISTQEIESAEQLYEILTILEDIGVSTFYSSKVGNATS